MTSVDSMERHYNKLLELVEKVISALAEDTYDDKLSGTQNAARQALLTIEQTLRKSIGELRRNAEWDTFTLAFYGETNAGKSTLIECLRILLNESGKVKQRHKFRSLHQQLGEANNSDQREALLADMQACRDGNIIGDGRPDYTREATAYTFKIDGQKFNLLDVPGTEGDEKKVNEQIAKALKRAHAVFYVTGKATPPQTGDKGNKGTLEKIKEHLSAQTEVWTVFNKRITNPMPLVKGKLLNASELASLGDLDAIMGEHLGKNYQGSLTLCARPAFLAVAECLMPEGLGTSDGLGKQDTASRKKFLDVLAADALLKQSGFEAFCRKLTRDLLTGYPAKIRQSNLNKLKVAIDQVCNEVDRQRREHFLPLALDLQHEAEHASQQLDNALKAIKSRLSDIGEQAIRNFASNVRRTVYQRIDSNLSNDDFKSSLRQTMTSELQRLQSALPGKIEERVSAFQKQVAEIVKRFQQHANDLLASYEALKKPELGGHFTLDFKLDSGINLYGLLASLAGGALMFWNPAGWVLMGLGAITLLTGIFKSVRGFFSSSYKMGQQRKSTDDNLDRACEQIRKSLRQSLDDATPAISQKLEEIRHMLWAPAVQAQQISSKLDNAHLQLKQLASTLK